MPTDVSIRWFPMRDVWHGLSLLSAKGLRLQPWLHDLSCRLSCDIRIWQEGCFCGRQGTVAQGTRVNPPVVRTNGKCSQNLHWHWWYCDPALDSPPAACNDAERAVQRISNRRQQ